ncbi:hypothetical protein LCGC14_0927030 [marine sediment metagenome]|uniref:Phage terminase large subunit C-terminal domain-containing protein n=1 Tax=marine sediment metagenome TaxID=412755 RepID=A0A0F9PA07_9ZZZZ
MTTLVKEDIRTRVYDETALAFSSGKRRILHEGGTSSSKTYSVIQFLIDLAQMTAVPITISIVSESLPHLKQGAMKDFFAILGESKENNRFFNLTESRYSRPDWKGVFEFFGADTEGKAEGPRREILFINQGEHVKWEVARQLDIRTKRFTILDWNPSAEFWVYQYETSPGVMVPGWLRNGREENAYCHSTYLDALDVLPEQTIIDIEAYKDTDPNWWRIYGEGELGRIEGLVYPFFEQVDELPKGEVTVGLDFGFRDVTAVVKNVTIGDSLYSEEILYASDLTNDEIARQMDLAGLRPYEIFADSAEPKSIEEIYQKGFNIKPAEKGPGSVEYGHQKVLQYKQYWTKSSTNCIKEQRNFRYVQDKEGKYTQETVHKYSHGMDARRYPVATRIVSVRRKSKHSMSM